MKPTIWLQWVRSKMLIYLRVGVRSKTLFSLIMAEDLIGLDILPRMTVMRPDFGLRFFLPPLLHTTLVNDIREKSNLNKKEGIFVETLIYTNIA